MAIAFMHIIPEVAHGYEEYMEGDDDEYSKSFTGGLKHGDEAFPLPFALVFIGYTVILLIDKVIFDTHNLVGENHHGHTHDPVQINFMKNARSSFSQLQNMASGDGAKESPGQNLCLNEADLNEGIREYLSRNEKFAVRMNVALKKPSRRKNASKSFAYTVKA